MLYLHQILGQITSAYLLWKINAQPSKERPFELVKEGIFETYLSSSSCS